jgi:hypothetical protein
MLCDMPLEVCNRVIKMNLFVTGGSKKMFRLAEHVLQLLVFCAVRFGVTYTRSYMFSCHRTAVMQLRHARYTYHYESVRVLTARLSGKILLNVKCVF